MIEVAMLALAALILGAVGISFELARDNDFEAFDVALGHNTYSIPSAETLGGGVKGMAKQTQTVITGLVIVITASLAVIVVDEFDSSLGTPQSSELSTAQNDVLGGFSDMVSLIGPLLLVLIAVVIVGVVQRLRG